LQRLRALKGVSQKAVADALDVQRPTVAQWEGGRFLPSVARLEQLDEYFGAGGTLVALRRPGRAEPVTSAPAHGPSRGLTLAEVFEGLADRLVEGVVHDPDDPGCLGWAHGIGPGGRPTPWSTALGVRALLLLDRAEVDLSAVARTLGQRQHHGGWSNRALDLPRPEVTAVVLATLHRIGDGGADLDQAWARLGELITPEDHHRPFVLSTVLENVAQIRPDSPLVEQLAQRLLAARIDFQGTRAWASIGNQEPDRVEPSAAHTARAIVALRRAPAHLDRPDVADGIAEAMQWLATNRNDDGVTEILRIDPEHRGWDVPVDHFTSAHVVRALTDAPVDQQRLNTALATLWSSYVPTERLWAWKHDGRLAVWINHDAVVALRSAAFAGFPSPHQIDNPESGEGGVRTHGGPPQPPPTDHIQ
jgi:transcriptional regulator with XRE-family HTH domain